LTFLSSRFAQHCFHTAILLLPEVLTFSRTFVVFFLPPAFYGSLGLFQVPQQVSSSFSLLSLWFFWSPLFTFCFLFLRFPSFFSTILFLRRLSRGTTGLLRNFTLFPSFDRFSPFIFLPFSPLGFRAFFFFVHRAPSEGSLPLGLPPFFSQTFPLYAFFQQNPSSFCGFPLTDPPFSAFLSWISDPPFLSLQKPFIES